jgi:NitT/TauT family transport system permease protein
MSTNARTAGTTTEAPRRPTEPTTRRPRSRTLNAWLSSPPVAPALLATLIIIVWWIAAAIADSAVFPTPAEALGGLSADLHKPRFIQSIGTTVRVLVAAYAAAAVAGTVAGVLLGLSAFWSRAILPIVYASNSIPKITLYPIFLMFLGISDLSRGAFAFVSGVIPMFLIAVEATAAVGKLHLKMAATLRLSWPQLLLHIVIPSVVPALVSGLRLTFGLTFLGLLLAEMVSGSSGIGFEILRNVTLARMENILGEVVLIAALALIPTLLLQLLERRVVRRFGRS